MTLSILFSDKTFLFFMFTRFIAIILLSLLSPLLAVCYVMVILTSKGPFLFKQLRMGKNKKPFLMYKIRTMIQNAEQIKKTYYKQNEADGPVFKIYNDPRYTMFGKWLSHAGLDELPQLINIMKGEMSFVGPRPLPVEEAEKVPNKYQLRFSILPGITSSWVVNGSHNLTFDEWMKLDLIYVRSHLWITDLTIVLKTLFLIIRTII